MIGDARKKTRIALYVSIGWAAAVLAGCLPSRTNYLYWAATDNCRCYEFRARDGKTDYLFRASYLMDDGILTTLEITITNHSAKDTLFTDLASVKVSSRNISYQYNNMFLPLPSLTILPQHSEVVKLTGKDISSSEDWHKIAGEQLTVTVKGVRLGKSFLKPQLVEFIPDNPKLQR